MGIKLVVQADDLGMCRAVNEGIEATVTDGIVTQASVMAPTPWFAEGAAMARRLGLATGLHSTFTSEWDYLRWAPLSAGASLRLDDGTQPRTVAEAAAQIDPAEGLVELQTQARRAAECGLDISYVDPHMGISVPTAYEGICAELGRRFIYPGIEPHHRFDSILILSMAAMDDLSRRTADFVDWLEGLDDGVHFVQSHPGADRDELRAVHEPDQPNYVWAHPWRVADVEALTSPEVRAVIERRGIELVSVAEL